MDKLGIEATIGSPQDFAAFVADEAPKWARIVEAGSGSNNVSCGRF